MPEPAKLASAEAGKAGADSGLFLRAVAAEQPRAVAAAPAVPADAGAPAAVDLSAVDAGYPGDDAPKEQIAAWMAKQAQARGLPPQLPVMAALVESGLQNLNHGDADSVGYFQMRLSIWNQGEYAGYADDPDKQLDWFLDTAERVKEQRVARNQSITDPDQFGEWIADVERPAEQYRGRYQLQLDEANRLLTTKHPPHTRAGGRRDRRGSARDGGRSRPEGAGSARGGREVHRHALPVGRLDTRDRLRLLGPRAVGIRARPGSRSRV